MLDILVSFSIRSVLNCVKLSMTVDTFELGLMWMTTIPLLEVDEL